MATQNENKFAHLCTPPYFFLWRTKVETKAATREHMLFCAQSISLNGIGLIYAPIELCPNISAQIRQIKERQKNNKKIIISL